MMIACWSLKGGSGTTVVAAALAALLGRRHPAGAVVVDLAGDLPAALGLPDSPGPGAADWLAAGPTVAPDGWSRLEVTVTGSLRVIPRGQGVLAGGERAEVLAGMLAVAGRPVVVDCGVLSPAEPPGSGSAPGAGHVLAAAATHSWLVTRPCYLALRRCATLPLRPSGVIVLREPARVLGMGDIEAVVGAPIVAQIPCDAAIARAVDRGDLAVSVPRCLARALRAAA